MSGLGYHASDENSSSNYSSFREEKNGTILPNSRDKKIDKIKLDHKFQILELQNEYRVREIEYESKHRDERTKLLRENQSLKYEIEKLKLETDQKNAIIEDQLKQEITNLEGEIDALRHYRCPKHVNVQLPCQHIKQMTCAEETDIAKGTKRFPECFKFALIPFVYTNCSHELNLMCCVW